MCELYLNRRHVVCSMHVVCRVSCVVRRLCAIHICCTVNNNIIISVMYRMLYILYSTMWIYYMLILTSVSSICRYI